MARSPFRMVTGKPGPVFNLMTEAMAMVDVARSAGVDVRLVGGLAVRRHCIDLGFADREYSDVDLVGLAVPGVRRCATSSPASATWRTSS